MNLQIKRGDTKSGFTAVLKRDGVAVNLTGATVYFHMAHAKSMAPKIVGGICEVTDAAAGAVVYPLEETAVDELGTFKAEFEVIYQNGGRHETFPNGGYILIDIIPDIR